MQSKNICSEQFTWSPQYKVFPSWNMRKIDMTSLNWTLFNLDLSCFLLHQNKAHSAIRNYSRCSVQYISFLSLLLLHKKYSAVSGASTSFSPPRWAEYDISKMIYLPNMNGICNSEFRVMARRITSKLIKMDVKLLELATYCILVQLCCLVRVVTAIILSLSQWKKILVFLFRVNFYRLH
jgi:hypothetical protein